MRGNLRPRSEKEQKASKANSRGITSTYCSVKIGVWPTPLPAMLVAVVIMRSSCRLTNCDVSDGVKPDHSRTCCVVLDRARYSTGPTAAANESTQPRRTTDRLARGEAAPAFLRLPAAPRQPRRALLGWGGGGLDLGRSRAGVEQVGAELALEHLDAHRHGRLRQAEPPGRMRHGFRLDNRDPGTEKPPVGIVVGRLVVHALVGVSVIDSPMGPSAILLQCINAADDQDVACPCLETASLPVELCLAHEDSMNSRPLFPRPENEPTCNYAEGTDALTKLRTHLADRTVVEIPAVVGGKKIFSDDVEIIHAPHDRSRVLARVHRPSQAQVDDAIRSNLEAAHDWSRMDFADRAAIMHRAAGIVRGRLRHRINAATMLGQSKTLDEAEADSACELIDFLHFNTFNAQQIVTDQPLSVQDAQNRCDWRPLEGFVYAVSPFNFTAIGTNLSCAPALMGNTVLWKPSNKSTWSNYLFFEALEEAGLPPGVINFVPGEA